MNWNRRRQLTRRHILTLFGITAAAVTVSAATHARFRFLWNTAADFLYGFIEPRSPVAQASQHPIQYYISPPRYRAGVSSTAAQPQALVITVDGNIEPIILRKKTEDSSFCAQLASARSCRVWKYQEGKTYSNAEARNAPSRRKYIRATQAEDCRPIFETQSIKLSRLCKRGRFAPPR